MSEISELYENAGVEKQGSCSYECSTTPYHNCKACKYKDGIHWYYPPFTAERQLVLIKWLAVNKGISIQYDDRYFEWRILADFAGGHYFDKFEITLADLINELWHSLTEEEKKQIREILK